jgi:hypothetical protein
VEGQRLAVDGECDVAQDAEVESGGGDDDVGFQIPAGSQSNAGRGEGLMAAVGSSCTG